MPSKIMDQMHLPSVRMSTGPSSFFSEEIRFPFERQVEFCKAESAANNCGNNRSTYVSSPPLEKLHPMTGNPFNCLEFPKSYVFKDHKNKISIERHHDRDFFSSSLSGIFNSKVHSVGTTNYNFRDDGPSELLEASEAQTIGNLLPDNDDLFSGVIDDVEYIVRPNFGDDTEDDLFYSGGGVEMEADDNFISNQPSDFVGEGASNGQPRRLCSSFSDEHPSRTLFVRNINSNAKDWELRDLFEQFGDIHILCTACKHHGFVVISYFDIRAAQNAMRALQNKPFRHQQLDIHFSVSKENPFDKDINHGTLVVFELDSSVSNEDLLQIFGVHGEIKEIREIPHDHHRKYVEFYDVRAAEIALHSLNKCDIAGKKIKLEASRPGGGKQCSLMQHLSPELDQEESNECRLRNSPYDTSEFVGTNIYSGLADAATRGSNSTIQAPFGFGTTFPGVSSSVPYNVSSLMRSANVANHDDQFGLGDFSHALGNINLDYQCTQSFHRHSLPEYQTGVNSGILFNSPSPILEMDIVDSRHSDGMISRHIHRAFGSSGLGNRSLEHQESAFGIAGNRTYPLHAHQYVWNGSGTYHHHHHHNHQRNPPGAVMWQSPPPCITGIPHRPLRQMHGLPRSQYHLKNTVLPLHHHHTDSVENMGFPASSLLYASELASRNIFPRPGGNFIDPSFPCHGTPSPKQKSHIVHSRNIMPGPYEHPPNDRVRSRRSVGSANQVDNKKQYELDIDLIRNGEDLRTTLMIKNIPNKYTSKMLLATIDEHHRGTFDFIYLPIDFKNKCNVGYAFINMIDPQHIIAFSQAFNGKKWEKFNSEKVASLAYARIQGKQALVAHFQNSSLMNEDKRCRPVLFHTDGPNAGDQEPFPMGVNFRSKLCGSRTANNEEGSPANGNTTDSSSGSSKG